MRSRDDVKECAYFITQQDVKMGIHIIFNMMPGLLFSTHHDIIYVSKYGTVIYLCKAMFATLTAGAGPGI